MGLLSGSDIWEGCDSCGCQCSTIDHLRLSLHPELSRPWLTYLDGRGWGKFPEIVEIIMERTALARAQSYGEVGYDSGNFELLLR